MEETITKQNEVLSGITKTLGKQSEMLERMIRILKKQSEILYKIDETLKVMEKNVEQRHREVIELINTFLLEIITEILDNFNIENQKEK